MKQDPKEVASQQKLSVEEGNKIIAEFMGIDVYETYSEVQLVPINKLNIYFLSGQGKYHISRDWLHILKNHFATRLQL